MVRKTEGAVPVLTLRFHCFRCNFSFGFSKLMLGGICLFSNANTTLMMAATPLAVSVCPMFVFTEPILRGRSIGLVSLNTEAIAATSMGSPVGVPVP